MLANFVVDLWSELRYLVSTYWRTGLLVIAAGWVAWYLVPPVLRYCWRRLRSRFAKGGRAPWFWGTQLNHRSGGDGQDRRCLVVFVHGLFPGLPERWIYRLLIDHFDDVLQTKYQQRDYLLFSYFGCYWSPRDPEWIVREQLQKQIETATSKHNYDAIILTAHSFGGLLVRQLVLDSRDANWYGLVERIVLMASPNRGFTAVSLWHKALELFSWSLLDRERNPAWLRFGHLTLSGLKGAPWVSDLRLRWITAFSSGNPPPLTFQILGGRDNLVSVDDDDDLRKYANFHPKLLPLIGHGHFTLELRRKSTAVENAQNLAAIEELKQVIAEALTEPHFLRELAAAPEEIPENIVLIVHGIRDFAEWHEELADAIHKLNVPRDDGSLPLTYQSHSIGYGYFSAYQFLSNRARHYCVRTLVDRYVQLRIKYPHARFHAVAHSNGTFAVGQALKDYRFVEFERIYLAGSVLTERYPWDELLRGPRKKAHRVMNLCASGDTPVGVLCWTLSSLDVVYGALGVGGSAGFQQATADLTAEPIDELPLAWNEWIVGDHNSGVRRNNFQNIAAFIQHGRPQRERLNIPGEMKIERIEDESRRTAPGVYSGRRSVAFAVVALMVVYVALFFLWPWTVIVGLTLMVAFIVGAIDFLLVF